MSLLRCLATKRVLEFTLPLGRVGPAGPERGRGPSPDAFASDPPALRSLYYTSSWGARATETGRPPGTADLSPAIHRWVCVPRCAFRSSPRPLITPARRRDRNGPRCASCASRDAMAPSSRCGLGEPAVGWMRGDSAADPVVVADPGLRPCSLRSHGLARGLRSAVPGGRPPSLDLLAYPKDV